MTDSRQRAPFPHHSSSADYARAPAPPPIQTRKSQNPPTWDAISPGARLSDGPGRTPTSAQSGNSFANGLWQKTIPMGRKESDEGRARDHILTNPYQILSTAQRTTVPEATKFGISIPSLSTVRFVLLCSLWYASSAVSSNTGKVILNNFKFPVTLTIVQFFFVASYCYLGSRRELGWTGHLRQPTKAILTSTTPMAFFQVGGHIFSSLAISRVPVSTVHTIKALSPLFTVLAYAVLFGVSYSPATYLSLLPLTLGVMLACSFDLSLSNALGLICAFGSTLVFVSSNIVFKKLMPSASESSAGSPRLDKINLLYYSSGMAFILMVPIWLYSDVPALIHLWFHPTPKSAAAPSVLIYFFLNGTVHFAQNLLAFAILSSTSPVTYSIASLVKRIAVICLAIVWFKQAVHPVQAVGIGLTAVGLWMYNNAKRDVEKGEKRMRQVEAVRDGMLPTTKGDQRILEGRSVTPGLEDGFHEKIHHSPKPSYTVYDVPTSVSSAVRSYPLPQAPQPAKFEPSVDGPYPSPPASTSSSPPNYPNHHSNTTIQPMQLPPPAARFRRLSNGNIAESAEPNNPPVIPITINEQDERALVGGA